MKIILVIAFFWTLIALLGLYLAKIERRLRNTWELVAEGEFAGALSKKANFRRRSGAMVHSNKLYRATFSTIFFRNGVRIVAKDVELPPVGTYIKVYKNGFAEFRIEIPEQQRANNPA